MALLRLDIYAVRNIHKATIKPSPTINFLYGENGSGKSALLEAIFLLGRARSFRTSAIKSVININEKQLTVSGVAVQGNGNMLSLGLQMTDKECIIHINHNATQKRSELAYTLPLQIIHPKSYELLDASGQIRREFLDWGIFNSSDSFLLVWRRFKKALAYRNFLLKKNELNQLGVWSNELITYGSQVNNFREQYLSKLQPVFMSFCQKILGLDSIELNWLSGWGNSASYSQAIADDLSKDLRYGFTHSGPQRGDFQILLDGSLAKNYVSRGQLKLLVVSLLLAQVQLLINEGGNPPCMLIDDFAAELDRRHREKILKCLVDMNCQVFMTAIEMVDFGSLDSVENYKMFHVEHGNVTSV